MADHTESTEDTRWRQLETSAKVDVILLVATIATVALLRGSDVLAILTAGFLLKTLDTWEHA